VGLRDDIRRRQQALQAGADAEAARFRLPRAVPGLGRRRDGPGGVRPAVRPDPMRPCGPALSSTLRRVHTRLTGLCAAATGLLLAGCATGSAFIPSTRSSTGSSTGSAAPGASSVTAAAGRPTCTADDITVQGGFGKKPTVTVPDTCTPSAKLVTKDLSTGTGAVVRAGGTVQADYLLVTWSDKKVVDTSFGRGPFAVQDVGHAQVIDGWNQGLIGMKQGGRRLLIVPPDLGYGQGGNGIQPNETLVFVIDAVTVTS